MPHVHQYVHAKCLQKAAGTPRCGIQSESVHLQLEAQVVHQPLTNDDAFASELLCEIDLVPGGALDKVNIWQLVANLDECGRRCVEKAAAGDRARQAEGTGGSKHDGE